MEIFYCWVDYQTGKFWKIESDITEEISWCEFCYAMVPIGSSIEVIARVAEERFLDKMNKGQLRTRY